MCFRVGGGEFVHQSVPGGFSTYFDRIVWMCGHQLFYGTKSPAQTMSTQWYLNLVSYSPPSGLKYVTFFLVQYSFLLKYFTETRMNVLSCWGDSKQCVPFSKRIGTVFPNYVVTAVCFNIKIRSCGNLSVFWLTASI